LELLRQTVRRHLRIMKMDKKTLDRLEELFYNYGETSKHIGRVETDGKADHMKKYEKLCKERDFVVSEFRNFVKQFKAA
jgi:hypothetical protein